VKACASPTRSQPSRTVPSAHSSRACPQECSRGRSRALNFTPASRRLANARTGPIASSAVAIGRTARIAGEDGASLEAATADGAPLARCAAISSPSGMLAVVTCEPSGKVSWTASPPIRARTSRPSS